MWGKDTGKEIELVLHTEGFNLDDNIALDAQLLSLVLLLSSYVTFNIHLLDEEALHQLR